MWEDQTDAYLVELALADDGEAFTVLIERYQVMLIHAALRYVDDEEIARELVQEALLQAYLSLDQLHDAARFKNWLYGIVLNLCHNWARQYKGGTWAPALSIDQRPLLAYYDDPSTPDPQELFVEQELHALVREAVHLLSPKNRSAMHLFYYEGLSLEEIAQQLNISLAAVKSRMHKGRDQVRTHLKTLYPELAEMSVRKETHMPMMPVKIAKILSPEKIYPRRTILVLLDEQNQRAVPLWFSDIDIRQSGRAQAFMQKRDIPAEPLTTDFIAHILTATGSTVEEIDVEALQGDILYARVQIRAASAKHSIKARLNDALPLAIHLKCPLAVSEAILTTMGMKLTDWGGTLEQQIDTVADLAVKTPVVVGNSQRTLHSIVPRNLNFADGLQGWCASGPSTLPGMYDCQLDSQIVYSNKNSLAITLARGVWRASLMHEGFLADHYRGQRMRMITYVKAQGVHRAFFEIAVVRPTTQQEGTRKITGSVTTTQQRPFDGTHEWTPYELVFDVAGDANSIVVSFEMEQEGKVWLDGLRFETVEKNVPVTGTQIKPPLQVPDNLDFARGLENWRMKGSFAQDYIAGIDYAATADGRASAYLKADKLEPRGSALLLQTVSGQNYRNKRVRFSATIRTVGVTQQAGLYVSSGRMDTVERRATNIAGTTDWTHYDLTFDVPDEEQSSIDFGLLLEGKGQIWLQDAHLEIVEALS